jgi:hypothetical protein
VTLPVVGSNIWKWWPSRSLNVQGLVTPPSLTVHAPERFTP